MVERAVVEVLTVNLIITNTWHVHCIRKDTLFERKIKLEINTADIPNIFINQNTMFVLVDMIYNLRRVRN